jgi:hypothetical protein
MALLKVEIEIKKVAQSIINLNSAYPLNIFFNLNRKLIIVFELFNSKLNFNYLKFSHILLLETTKNYTDYTIHNKTLKKTLKLCL